MNKWIWIIIAIVVAVAIIVAGGFAIVKHKKLLQPLDGPGMVNDGYVTYVYYIRGGGMDGGRDEIRVKLDEESDTVSVEIDSREYYGAEEIHREFVTDRQLLTDIGKVVTENNLKRASHRGDSHNVVLDAASYTLNIELHSGEEISVSSTQRLTAEETEAVKQIVQMIKDAE